MRNIDFFRSWGKAPQMNGLGFIWLNRTPSERWNFYHPTLTPVVVDEYHNHRSTFRSRIMKGKLYNKRGVVVEGNDVIRNIDCITFLKKGEAPDFPIIEHGVRIWELETEEYNQKGLAVYNKDKRPLCPIADFVTPEKECWEILEVICQS